MKGCKMKSLEKNNRVTISKKDGWKMNGIVSEIERVDENGNFSVTIECTYT